jgi:hypothetical protein
MIVDNELRLKLGWVQWLKLVILASQRWETKIKRITFRDQSKQTVPKTSSQPIVGCDGVPMSSQLCEKAQIG